MDFLQRIWSSENLTLDVDDFDERGFGNMDTPLPIEMSQPINTLLDKYDLATLYAINTRLVSLSKSLLQLLSIQEKLVRQKKPVHQERLIHVPSTIYSVVEVVKHIKDELFDVKGVFDYINHEPLTNEICQFAHRVKDKDSSFHSVEDYPALRSLFLLQQVIQKRIESFPLGKSKAESLLESNVTYSTVSESAHDDEAIIYCLTEDKKCDRIQFSLDYYVSGKTTEVNSDVHIRNTKFKKLLKKKEAALKDALIHLNDDGVQTSIKLPDLIKEPNSLRLLQISSVMLLHTALSQRKGGTMYRLPPNVAFDLSRSFSLFKSETAIQIIHRKLELLLHDCHKFLQNIPSDTTRRPDEIYCDNYVKSRIDALGMASLFVFGCHRIGSNLIREETYDVAVKLINDWQKAFNENQEDGSVTSAAMAVHALYLTDAGISANFGDKIRTWLLSKQHKYGHWCQDANHKPINTTVLILDAIELTNKKPNTTFDLSFICPIGSIRQDSQTQLYVELDIDAKQLMVGTKPYILTDKIWKLMRELIDWKKLMKPLPLVTSDGNWKNAVDMLRRKLGKKNFDHVITSVRKCGYCLNPNVRIKGGSQIGIRNTYCKKDTHIK